MPGLRVLGSITIDGSGTVVSPAAKQRLLLGILLSRVGRPVSAALLTEALWGTGARDSARNNLAAQVRRLRKSLRGLTRLDWESGGYVLRAGPDDVDASVFERLYLQARSLLDEPARASALLQHAIGLWHGPAYGELADHPALHGEAVRLDGLRLSAMELRFDADLALGRHTELVDELAGQLVLHPLRERLRGQLMLALYRADRQAEALQTFRDGRALSIEELGLEPGERLRALEKAILTADPAIAAPVNVEAPARRAGGPAELPPGTAAFTGRQAEVSELGRLLTARTLAPVVISAISGSGGVGKSALAIHTAHQVASRFPDGQLYLNLRGATPEAEPLEPRAALARLLRSLGDDSAAALSAVEELSARFRSAVSKRRFLILLDDARDVAQVRPLLPAEPGCGVIITSRRMLSSLDGSAHCPLGVMTDADAVALLANLIGPDRAKTEPAALAEVARLCGHLPLALCIAAARLNSRPDWEVGTLARRLAAADQRLSLLDVDDRAVRASFAVGYQELILDGDGTAAARMFRLMSLLDCADLSLPLAAATAGCDETAAARQLAALVDAKLVDVRAGRFGLHDLMRLFARELSVREDSDAERAAALQRARHYYLATARSALGAVDAHQQDRCDEGPQTLSSTPLSFSDRAEAVTWVQGELPHLQSIAQQAATTESDGPHVVVALVSALLPVLNELSCYSELNSLCRIAKTAADVTGDSGLLTAASHDLGYAELRMARPRQARQQLETALALVGDGARSAGILWLLGEAHSRLGRQYVALDFLGRSLKLARRNNDARGVVCALVHHGFVYRDLAEYSAAEDYLGQAADAALAAGHRFLHVLAIINRAEVQLLSGDTGATIAQLTEAAVLVDGHHTGPNLMAASIAWTLGVAHYQRGDHARANQSWRGSATILRGLDLIDDQELAEITTAEGAPVKPSILLP